MVHRAADGVDGAPVWVMNHGTSGGVTGPGAEEIQTYII